MDRLGAVAGQQREVMHLARRAGFDHQSGRRAQAVGDQMLVHGARGQQRRNGDIVGIDLRSVMIRML